MTQVLYVGPLDKGGTCYSRMIALRELGLTVVPFDQRELTNKLGIVCQLPITGMFPDQRLDLANEELIKVAGKSTPKVIWIDKGFWLRGGHLKRLREHGHHLVHHCTDCISRPKNIRHYLASYRLRKNITLYNCYLTTNHFDYRFYRKRGLNNVHLTWNGYDSRRFKPCLNAEAVPEQGGNDLLLVGHHEPRTERFIVALAKAGLNVKIYGSGWEKSLEMKLLKKHLALRQASDAEYVQLLQTAKIGLCFPSEINRSETVGRSFETAACGTFLLAMRTAEHEKCFVAAQEADFFSDSKELVAKARHYLENEALRRGIAKNGLRRCQTSGYSWQEIMACDWQKVNTALCTSGVSSAATPD